MHRELCLSSDLKDMQELAKQRGKEGVLWSRLREKLGSWLEAGVLER